MRIGHKVEGKTEQRLSPVTGYLDAVAIRLLEPEEDEVDEKAKAKAHVRLVVDPGDGPREQVLLDVTVTKDVAFYPGHDTHNPNGKAVGWARFYIDNRPIIATVDGSAVLIDLTIAER